MNNNNNQQNNNESNNDPSNAMNTKQDVAQSPDEKIGEDFRGYPHYPAREDKMDESTGSHHVDAKLEETASGTNATGVSQRYPSDESNNRADINPLHRDAAGTGSNNDEMGTPQNVSNEDLPHQQSGTDVDEAAEKGSLNP